MRWRQSRAAAASGLAFCFEQRTNLQLDCFLLGSSCATHWAGQSPSLGSATPDRQPLLCSRPVSLDPLQVRVLRPESYW